MLLLTFVNACPWFSVLCSSGCPCSSLGPLVWAISWMSQWYHLLDSVFRRTHLFGFLLMFCLCLFSTFYDEVTTCELLGH